MIARDGSTRPSVGRRIWPALVVGLGFLAGYGEIPRNPGSLVVDGRRPSVDTNAPPGFRSIGNDLTRFLLPRWVWVRRAVERTGRVPSWDPSGFGGRPLVGNPQAGLAYPPSRLLWRLGGPALPGWLTLAHLALGAWGAYLLARACGQRRAGATLASLSFALGPQLVGHFQEGHYPHLWSVAWYPWAFLALLRLHRERNGAGPELSLVLGLSLMTGHVQEGLYLVLALLCLAMARILRSAFLSHWNRVGQMTIRTLGISLAVMGLTAAEWIPIVTVAPLAKSPAQGGSSGASGYDCEPIHALQLLSPRALGLAPDYIGPGNLWESWLSFGWVVLVLAIVGVVRGRPRGMVLTALALGLGTLVFAAGPKLGLYALIERTLPGFSAFRTPGRALLLTTLAVSVLAGFGLDLLTRGGWTRRSALRVARLSGALLILVGLGSLAGTTVLADGCGRTLRDPVFLLSIVGTTLSLLAACRPGWSRSAVLGLLALASIELAWNAHQVLELTLPSRFLGPTEVGMQVRTAEPRAGVRVRARDAFYSDLDAARDGMEKANVGDLFQLQSTRHLADPLLVLFSNRPWPRSPREIQAALDRLGVALLVSDQPDPRAAWPIAQVHPGFTIWRNPSALPRAYVVPAARVLTQTDDPLKTLAAIDPRAEIVLDHDPLKGLDQPRQPFLPARCDSSNPDRQVVEISTSGPCLLVLCQAWMPGWTASVNRQPARVLRGDFAWQVVPLPEAGQYQVVFRYRPIGRRLGTLLSVITLILVAGVGWRSRVGARGPAESQVNRGRFEGTRPMP